MKVLLVNGSPRANGNTAFALNQMAEAFAEQGIETELFAKNEAAAKERWEHLNKLVEMYKD